MKHSKLYFTALLALFTLVCTSGCGAPEVHRVKVTGKVTLDGKLLSEGIITFVPIGGQTPSGGGGISSDGSYLALVPPGKKKVLIASYKTIGQRPEFEGDPNSRMVDNRVLITPQIYNIPQRTPLEIDIADNEQVTHDFKLVATP